MLKAKSTSPLSSIKLSFFKSPKFWGLFAFLIVLAGLPAALFEVQQQQQTQQHATFFAGQQRYFCNNNLTVLLTPVSETPSACSTGSFSGVTSFKTVVNVQAVSGSTGSYTIHWNWGQFFCTKEDPGACINNPSGTPKTTAFSGTGSVNLSSDTVSPVAPFSGQACGYYQFDFGFYITDNNDASQRKLCTAIVDLSPIGLNNLNNTAAWCHSGKTCASIVPTNTPTPTLIPTVSPTPTVTPTGLPSDTPTPTPLPSDTPTPTIPVTPTVTPTGTLTPTLSPTATPTGAPTATPVPPGSPTPTIIVVRPTLPPTGPSNTIVAVGLVGVAISVLGLTLLIGI